MACPSCGSTSLVYWSETTMASYGNACLACKLFVFRTSPDGELETLPLEQVPFPYRYRSTPAYRAAVGWVGP